MTCPLCSTGITPLRRYYEAVRPSPAHRYFRPRGWSRLELGFGGITDILLNRDKGVRLVGPLPAETQNYTSYTAALIAISPNAQSARVFMTYLASRDGRALFAANGISE